MHINPQLQHRAPQSWDAETSVCRAKHPATSAFGNSRTPCTNREVCVFPLLGQIAQSLTCVSTAAPQKTLNQMPVTGTIKRCSDQLVDTFMCFWPSTQCRDAHLYPGCPCRTSPAKKSMLQGRRYAGMSHSNFDSSQRGDKNVKW